MRALMITPNFPPQLSPISLNNAKLAKALVEAGVALTVVTQRFDPAKYLRDDSPFWQDGVGRVIELDPPWLARFGRVGNYPAKLRFLERHTSWFGSAALTFGEQLLTGESFDLLITRGLPIDAALAGYRLKRRFGIRWVAGFNDPFPPDLNPADPDCRPGWFGAHERAVMRRILSAADFVACPSPRLVAYLDRELGLGLGERGVWLPHMGWRGEAEPRSGPEFELVHAGTLGPNVPPLLFLLLRDELAKRPGLAGRVRARSFGKVHENTKRYLREHDLEWLARVEAPVPYRESLKRIAGAIALLQLEFPYPEGFLFLSKFADYAVSGRPLLLYCPEDGTVADLVGGFSHPGFLGQERARVAARLGTFLDLVAAGGDLSAYAYPRPEEFTPRAVVARFLARIGEGGAGSGSRV